VRVAQRAETIGPYFPLFPACIGTRACPNITICACELIRISGLDAGFLGRPTVLGVIDTYGVELIHPMREGRSPQQIGRKGSPIIAGLLAGNSVFFSISGELIAWHGRVTRPMLQTRPFSGHSPS